MEISISAEVNCTDGSCGQISTIIVDPHKQEVTHLVVKDKSLPDSDQRLVPIEQVAEATHDHIQLRCSRNDLADMDPFIEIHYIVRHEESVATGYTADGGYVMAPRAAVATEYCDEQKVERIPPGELAVRRGMEVKASDGQIGHVAELVIDTGSGHTSHLVLEKGHLWGKKLVTVPVSEVDFADADAVYLKLDKQAIGQLPTVPVRIHLP
jgi:sporulation protein YlmC with PRC-barrel domain